MRILNFVVVHLDLKLVRIQNDKETFLIKTKNENQTSKENTRRKEWWEVNLLVDKHERDWERMHRIRKKIEHFRKK